MWITNSGGAIETKEFVSEESCKAAAERFSLRGRYTDAFCIADLREEDIE